jgi:hypothetical protein
MICSREHVCMCVCVCVNKKCISNKGYVRKISST